MTATVPIGQREHALLSASGAQKWLNCPPSARLEDSLPEETSPYAEEGRMAHAVAELLVRSCIENTSKADFQARLKQLQQHPLYQPEMLEHGENYLDYIKSLIHAFSAPPHVAVEKRLDYSAYVPEGFGTGDCLILGGSVLHIVDYKYGQGKPVDAEDNPQMKLYALGAIAAYEMLYAVDTVRMTIFQPRLGIVSEWETSVADLRAWGESIKPVAQLAYKGEGEFCPGPWCDNGFCKARYTCRARSGVLTAVEAFGKKEPALLTPEEVGAALEKGRELAAWVNALEEYALAQCLAGNEIPGWKAVEGRSNRQFSDVDAAFAVLKAAGYDEALLYERRPIPLTAVEKLTGKKQFEELLGSYVIKPPGKPTLVPASDRREPITNQITAKEAFAAQN